MGMFHYADSGGPSLGDIRSRLIRLAAIAMGHRHAAHLSHPRSQEALHALLSYRLPIDGSSRAIKQEWMDILEGKHKLWQDIDPEKRECVRGFLVQFESDVLHRAHRNFNFRGGSIGNFFLVAMQRFFRSIQSAIFLFSALVGIQSALPEGYVFPAINTNRTTTIAALLEDGSTIVGQCEISHPTPASRRTAEGSDWSMASTRLATPEITPSASIYGLRVPERSTTLRIDSQKNTTASACASDASSPHSVDGSDFGYDAPEPTDYFDTSGKDVGNLIFSKLDEIEALPSPIQRTCLSHTGVFYVNVHCCLTSVAP